MYLKALEKMRKEHKPKIEPSPSIIQPRSTEGSEDMISRVFSMVRQRSEKAQQLINQTYEDSYEALSSPKEESLGTKLGDVVSAPKEDTVSEDGEVLMAKGGRSKRDLLDEEGKPFTKGGTADLSGFEPSDEYEAKMINVESGGKATAKNPLSSAYGLAQFTKGTWLGLVNQMKESGEAPWAEGLSEKELLSLRADPEAVRPVLTKFRNRNKVTLVRNDIPINDVTEYGAHFLGAGTAVKLFKSDVNTPVIDVVGRGVVKANPFLKGKTVGDTINFLERKMS